MADEEKRPVPVGPGERTTKIPRPAGALCDKLKKETINMLVAGAGHDGQMAAFGIKTGAEADAALAESERVQREERQRRLDAQIMGTTAAPIKFERGRSYYDTSKNRKVTIIRANATVTKKSRTPCHEVVDRGGNTWYAKQSDLVRLP